jgi:hypothetical protein
MESCLSIYTVSFPNQSSMAASNERSGLYEEHNNGTEIMDLRKARSLDVPTDWFQLRLVLGAYHRLVQILLGEQHCVPLGLLALIELMDDLAATAGLNTRFQGARPCAEFMCTLDIYTWSWANQQERSLGPVLPWYALIGEELHLHKWIPPPLPAKLLAAIKPAAGARSPQT